MDEVRLNRVRAQMKDELSVLINHKLSDPRVPTLTITDVVLTRDAKQATVMISVVNLDGTERDPQIMIDCIEGLNSAKPFLKKSIAHSMTLRSVPDLFFKEDKGLENTLRVHELLKQIEAEKKPT